MTKAHPIEKDVKRQVKALLDKHNYFWWMVPANGFGRSGVSDFNAIRAGTFIAIETKVGKNKPTEMQKGYLNSIAAEQGFSFVVNDSNIESFAAWLDAFDRAKDAVARGERPSPEDGSIMLNALNVLQI